jgi:hypothetical protein
MKMKATRFSAFNFGTGRDPYNQGLQPYPEFAGYGAAEEKPFADIPTAVKVLVVGAIIMAFVAPKRTGALANPRKRKNPDLGWDEWERDHPYRRRVEDDGWEAFAGDPRSDEEKKRSAEHGRGEPERITQPWAPKPLRFVEVLSPEMAGIERARYHKGWVPKREGDVLSYRRRQPTFEEPPKKKKKKEEPSFHAPYSAKAPEGGLWWEYQARRTDRRGEDEPFDWENLSWDVLGNPRKSRQKKRKKR